MKNMLYAFMAFALLTGGSLGFSGAAYAGGAEKGAEEGVDNSVSFVRLDPLVLPIIDGSGVSQVVSIVIVLEVEDQFIAAEVRRMTPKLKDAYIQDMYGMLNRKASMEGGLVKVSEIKKYLNIATSKVLGKDAVNNVLLEVLQQRPI